MLTLKRSTIVILACCNHNGMQAWSHAVNSLGTNGGLQTFLEQLSKIYARAFNIVMMYNPGKSAHDLTVVIDEEMYKVEDNHVSKLFKVAWNDSVSDSFPAAMISGEVVMDEWRWAIAHMVVATRHAFSSAIRLQFNEDLCSEAPQNYESDAIDEGKTLYCTGVVWDSVKKHFSKNDRVLRQIETMFLERQEAVKQDMPTTEIDSRYEC